MYRTGSNFMLLAAVRRIELVMEGLTAPGCSPTKRPTAQDVDRAIKDAIATNQEILRVCLIHLIEEKTRAIHQVVSVGVLKLYAMLYLIACWILN